MSKASEILDRLREGAQFTDVWIKKGGKRTIVVMNVPDKNKIEAVLDKILSRFGFDVETAGITIKRYKKRKIEGYEVGIPEFYFGQIDKTDYSGFMKDLKREFK